MIFFFAPLLARGVVLSSVDQCHARSNGIFQTCLSSVYNIVLEHQVTLHLQVCLSLTLKTYATLWFFFWNIFFKAQDKTLSCFAHIVIIIGRTTRAQLVAKGLITLLLISVSPSLFSWRPLKQPFPPPASLPLRGNIELCPTDSTTGSGTCIEVKREGEQKCSEAYRLFVTLTKTTTVHVTLSLPPEHRTRY